MDEFTLEPRCGRVLAGTVRHILSRFIWTVQGAGACRWEQAYSADGGRSWETNWTMEFTRTP